MSENRNRIHSGRRNNVAIESFFVVLLMMVFAIAVAVLIVQGSSTFEKTLDSREREENLRIAMSYINMMVRQNDALDTLSFPAPFDDIEAILKIEHQGKEAGYVTFIYYQNGTLKECYSQGQIDENLSSVIVPIDGLKMNYNSDKGLLICTYAHEIKGEPVTLEQTISMRAR